MGPPVSMIAGTSALAAPISCAGVVLSHPARSTTPSRGCPRIISSVSIAARLRKNMLVGLTKTSPMEMVGNSRGSPPACRTPRLTNSASSFRPRLQWFSSDAVLQIPITGRCRSASS